MHSSCKILQNLHCRFVLCCASQIYTGDFAKFCGLLRIYEPIHCIHYVFLFYFFQYLEQEKYRLRQQLRLMEDEYEQRILELQSDIDTLKSKLADTDTNSRLQDRERSNLVAQLTEQNQRLTSELQARTSLYIMDGTLF